MIKNIQLLQIKQILPIKKTNNYLLKFDGCSKGNPGLSGAGAVIYKNGLEIWSKSILPPCTVFTRIPCHIYSKPVVVVISGIKEIGFALVPFADNFPRNSK